MHPFFLTFKTVLFALLLLVFQGKVALALSVDNIRLGFYEDKTRMVLDLSESSQFKAFVLDSPERMVIDLPSFEWKAGAIQEPEKADIAAVRYGNLKPGISRIVFDMNKSVALKTAFILPKQSGKPDRLVLDFSTEQAVQNTKNRIIGNLNVEEIVAEQKPYQAASAAQPAPVPPQKTRKPLIVIDPGHGGVDPGAVATGKNYEKHIVLALAKELKAQLMATGKYRVLLTRDKDIFIKLSDRVRFARKHDADLFVSIHADSIANPGVSGASFYTLSEKASDKQTAKLAARENKADLIAGIDLSTEDDEVANILVDLAMRDTTNQGKFFANTLLDAFKGAGLRVLDNGHRHAGFAVLKAPDIPSVLIEAGFMSNRNEAALLKTKQHRKKLATALKKGIDLYFEQVKRNQRI